MSDSTPFSCYVIGGDTLLTECCEAIIAQGHQILGVITSAPRVAEWADGKDLPVIDAKSSYGEELKKDEFDYLFAITHLAIIPEDVIGLPKKAAINFHDGPLPRYAGLNTPIWALLNQESEYGISWHHITAGVDEGDILEQRLFELSSEETALSLNTRCFAQGLESFSELIEKLSKGEEEATAQDLTERSVFTRHQRPEAGVTINFGHSAAKIEALTRGLNFGRYENPVGSPKVQVGDKVFIVTNASARDEEGMGAPGAVLNLDGAECLVTTGEGILAITGFSTLCGIELTPGQFAEQSGLEAGQSFKVFGDEESAALTKWTEDTVKAEGFWTKRLRTLEPIELAYGCASDAEPNYQSTDFTVPEAFSGAFGDTKVDALLAGFGAYLARTGNKEKYDLGFKSGALSSELGELENYFAAELPLSVKLSAENSFSQAQATMGKELARIYKRRSYLKDIVARNPDLSARPELKKGLVPVGVYLGNLDDAAALSATRLTLAVAEDGSAAKFIYDDNALSAEDLQTISGQFATFLENLGKAPEKKLSEQSLLSDGELNKILRDWNQTSKEYDKGATIHRLFEAQVERTPDAPAVVFEGDTYTYKELNIRANQLAVELRTKGIGAGKLVGIYVERSLDLMVSIMGTLKAGGAYLPLDPDFPADRIAFMVEDTKAPVIIAQSHLVPQMPNHESQVIEIDGHWETISDNDGGNLEGGSGPDDLAYVIFTSGSTGKPKGVQVEHRNAVNFFEGMDDRVEKPEEGKQGSWLAVTSLSFDISVLELFWTLTRGFKVVVYKDHAKAAGEEEVSAEVLERKIDFGLFMWGNDDGPGPQKYRLMMEGSKYFDENGFNSVWTPERHFHAFGGPYPNPSVTGAAIAAVTKNVSIRSGSCVSPLHHPVRIAEEWSVVDNLSNGRVGLSFAAGWQPNDFVIMPQNHKNNKQVMLDQIEIVQKLWRGEAVEFENPMGDMVPVTTLPRPVQKELPFWVTTAGNPATYEAAGRTGAHVLTHLLGQSFEEVEGKIKIYREAREKAGYDPSTGIVTLMLHSFVGKTREEARQMAKQPLKDYLGSSVALVKGFAWAFPAFKRPPGENASPMDIDLGTLTEEELDAILEFAFDRYFDDSGLFGTIDEAVKVVNKAKSIDVDEIACLLDFGVPTDAIMESLPRLVEVSKRANAHVGGKKKPKVDVSIAAQIRDNGITHLQCTPSMARMMLLDDDAREALKTVDHMMVGGEAFPVELAKELSGVVRKTVTNMYGPTETTIWSSTHRLAEEGNTIPIGTPIANTQLYVLDNYLQPVPAGVPGELYIGGDGVVRGYLGRPELTAQRFVKDPFQGEGARMYRTGDLVRFRTDGVLEFIGRTDHQVKVRGYRIELGEIETQLSRADGVREAVVIVREDTPGNVRLVGYVVPQGADPDIGALKNHLRTDLPEYMVPTAFAVMKAMPLTPNGKVDRKALPNPDELAAQQETVEYVAPENETEAKIAEVWQKTLGKDKVGIDDNFFDIGGHSLLVVRMHRELKVHFEQTIALTDLYRFPTIRGFTDFLSTGGVSEGVKASGDRAAKRKEAMQHRRRRR